eukprot:scaffold552_cov526-Prasinococcus_capsulatus_cf.AAC.6
MSKAPWGLTPVSVSTMTPGGVGGDGGAMPFSHSYVNGIASALGDEMMMSVRQNTAPALKPESTKPRVKRGPEPTGTIAPVKLNPTTVPVSPAETEKSGNALTPLSLPRGTPKPLLSTTVN